jgi:hypothetical protein
MQMKTKERRMAVDSRLRRLAAGVCLAALTGTVYAAESTLDLTLPAKQFYTQEAQSFMLAANDTDAAKAKANVVSQPVVAEFEPKLFSGSKIHQYLGVGTAVLAGAAFITHPHPTDPNAPRLVNGTHAQLAKATVAMAAATVAAGLLTHWDDFSLEDGWSDPDNLHVLLGTAGAALMAYAVNKSANSSTPVSHATMSELGALSMIVAIKLTW